MTQEPKEKNTPNNESESEMIEELIARRGKDEPVGPKDPPQSSNTDKDPPTGPKDPPQSSNTDIEALLAMRGKEHPKGPKDPPQSSKTDNEQTDSKTA